jgi:hypothetical protein
VAACPKCNTEIEPGAVFCGTCGTYSPTDSDAAVFSSAHRPAAVMPAQLKWVLALMVLVVYALHQDVWNWHDKTLVFGFLPKGLFYHAGYAVLASLMMWVLVRCAWPEHIERSAEGSPETPQEDPH